MMPKFKKDPPGRPPDKKKNLSLQKIATSEIYHFNKKNIVPPSLIDNGGTGYDNHNKFLVYVKSIYGKKFFDMLSIFNNHKCRKLILHFDETGLLITNKLPEHQDLCSIECKILYHFFYSYKITEPISVLSDVDKLYILFSNNKKGEFLIKIIEKEGKYYLKFKSDISIHKLSNKYKIGHYEVVKNDCLNLLKPEIYDNIIILDADSFGASMACIKKTSSTFDMICNFGILVYKPKCVSLNYEIKQSVKDNAFHIIKSADHPYIGTYNLNSFAKFLKFKGMSQIVKIYLKSGLPMIIEFDVGIKNPIGAVQINVKEQLEYPE